MGKEQSDKSQRLTDAAIIENQQWLRDTLPSKFHHFYDALVATARSRCQPVYGSCNLPSGHTGKHDAYAASHVAPTNQWAGTEIIFDASAPSTTPRSEAAERVANFLRVLDRVWPNHPDRLLTTGAATALLKSDLQALVSVASAIVPNGWKLVPVAPTDEMWTRFTQRTISSLTTG